MDFLRGLEQIGYFTWVREASSLWAYPTFLFLHTMGMTLVVGLSTALSLRILGFGRDVPLAPMARLFPIIWAAFAINTFSGTTLLIADATTKLINPVFYVKMLCIVLALVSLLVLRKTVFNDPLIDQKPLPASARFLAFASVLLWVGGITGGRLMAYIGPVSGLE